MPIVLLIVAMAPKFNFGWRIRNVWSVAAAVAIASSIITLVLVQHRYW